MKALELAEDSQMVAYLREDVAFDQFVDQMLSLDKDTYNKIYDDPEQRQAFAKLTPTDRLQHFSPEFQNQIRELYETFNLQKQTTHSLALGIYRLGQLTGASYKDIANHLEVALQKQFSKSYISKLYRVGKMLTAAPSLAIVSDTEKLAELSRIPEHKLNSLIEDTKEGIVRVANCDIASASRSKIQEIVRAEIPPATRKSSPSSKQSQVVSPLVSSNWNLDLFKDSLKESLKHVEATDLRSAIENCIRIIEEGNQ